MQVEHKLQVWKRERTGSRYARRERTAGRLPAVLYGHGKEPVALSLDSREAIRCFHSGERVFDIELKDEKASQTVMLKEIQFDHLGTDVVHVDLTRVDMDEEVESAIELRLTGECVGLKMANAMLIRPVTALEVRCTVRELVDHIDVDITDLDVGDALHAESASLPDGYVLLTDPETVIVQISERQIEEEDTATEGTEAEAVGAESSEPEVIKEKKDEEEQAGS